MRVLVTGGAGFIGPHVVAALRRTGHEPVVFDLTRPKEEVAFIQGDLTDVDDCTRAARGVGAICHIGGIGDVYLAFEKPQLAAAVNVQGSANIMEAAQRTEVAKVVYASTWEVYGQPVYEPLDERHPCNPDHPYNITKLAGERLVLAYDRLKGVPAVALRLGTAYGEGMRSNAVFPLFFRRALRREPIMIKGDGLQFRQFTHAQDIARAFVAAVEADVHGEVFNIVSEETTSIRALAEIVAGMFPTEIEFEPARAGDIAPATVSAQKAQDALGWRAEISMRHGLEDLGRVYAAEAEMELRV